MNVEEIMSETITAQEIKEIRNRYGLTQKSFATLLGIGTASMARYEQGATPTKANANLIRAAKHPEFMRECLERDGELISQRQREEATRCIYAFVSLEPEDGPCTHDLKTKGGDGCVGMTMDEAYHYTIQQEVLNEQAANLIGEMISIKVTCGFKGTASDVFDNLLDQIATMKPTIVSDESMDDYVLSKHRGYLRCAGDLLKRSQQGAAHE